MNIRQLVAVAILLGLGLVAGATGSQSAEAVSDFKISNLEATQEVVFQSRILREERTLLIRKPQGYEDGTMRYPVLFVLDAEWHFNIAAADVELLSECSYIESHPSPQLIVVGVVNVDRNRDFTPTICPEQLGMKFPSSGGAQLFRRFLVQEVIPLVDETYRTRPFRILAGWSLGGLFTINTLLSDTPIFDSYLAISPSLWWDDCITLKEAVEGEFGLDYGSAKQLVTTLGTVEKENDSTVARSTNEFREHLEKHPLKNLTVDEVTIEGLGHNYSPKMAYFYGVATIFGDLNPPTELLAGGLAAIDAYYATLTERYRFEVPVPEGTYGKLGWSLFEAGRTGESGDVFRSWAERHPQSALALASLGSFYRETGNAEDAIALFKRAIDIEEHSAQPRTGFVHDLRRDVDALQQGD